MEADCAGFIGLPTAQAFVRAGHIVYGSTRSDNSKGELIKEEIIPVVLDPGSNEGVEAFVEIAKDVDVGESFLAMWSGAECQ